VRRKNRENIAKNATVMPIAPVAKCELLKNFMSSIGPSARLS